MPVEEFLGEFLEALVFKEIIFSMLLWPQVLLQWVESPVYLCLVHPLDLSGQISLWQGDRRKMLCLALHSLQFLSK